MDFTQMSVEDKLEKYNSQVVPEDLVETKTNYLNYAPLPTQQRKEFENSKELFKPLVSNVKYKPQTDIEFLNSDKSFGFINTNVDRTDPKNITWNQVDMRYGSKPMVVEDLSAKMKDVAKPTATQKRVMDSIDKSKYDADTKRFLKLLAYKESRFIPTEINKYGYRGLYQFGDDALKTVRMKSEDYMANIEMQHKAAVTYGQMNIKGLEKYIGKVVGGIKMTKSKMMAASHLGGRTHLVEFLESNGKLDFKDGREGDKVRTPLSNYLNYF